MGITTTEISTLRDRLSAIRGGALQTAVVNQLHENTRPIEREMDLRAVTRIQNRAMDSVQITAQPKGIELSGGDGGGLGAVLFAGAEFGGRSPRKKRVPGLVFGRPVKASPGTVVRRTTMMFKPYAAQGAFFLPTVREAIPDLIDQVNETAVQTVAGR